MAAVGPVKEPSRTKDVKQKTSFTQEEAEKYDEDEEVRVIVELKGAPAIEYATKQGKKFSDLSESKKTELQNKALSEQKVVKSELSKKKVDIKFEENFTTAFNGFSGVVKYGKLKSIKSLKGVENVYIANEYERPEAQPDMKYSKELVEAQKAWDDYGYTGEGMIVGVIDSGIDPSHKDMILTDDKKAALSKEKTESLISDNNLPGKFYTGKVPYGYNYMDKNDEVRDLGPGASMHGMHVSGTVGANGDEDNGGIKGVAPEAQLLALKVFGNDPNMGSTWGDIYIKAIDDAIILGADVLNMSLGSTASFVNEEDPEQKAIARAVENGVLMSISAGNSAHLGNGFWNPYASNPDIGVVGAPGLSYDSIQVASIDNSFMDLDAAQATYDGEKAGLHPFLSASSVHPNDLENKTFELVHVGGGGTGVIDDWADADYEGKFVLVRRGNSFTDTAFNAQNVGAAGVIVYNHSDGYVNMASDPGITIPQLFMLKVDGEELAAKVNAGVEVTLTFNGDVTTAPNPTAGKMSAFTSWGVTPNLDFKPEITAPGGNIYSTFQNDTYGVMSGTSMAAPHVSGGSALVLQRVAEDFSNLQGKAKVEMAKNILMNTAKVVQDKGTINTMFGFENPYSPRRQGAGLMQLHAALSTPVVVTEEETGIAKVALKEVGDTFNFTLKATNYSDKAIEYDVTTNVQTDLALFGELGYAADELEAQELEGAKVKVNGGKKFVEVPANGTVTLDVSVDLTDAKVLNADASGYVDPETIFPNGYFVEGYVTLVTNEDRVNRLEGQNLYKTSALISTEGWESSDVVILARGDKFSDALAGVPLAAKHNAPLILTRSEKLDAVTKAEIERLGAKEVIILGGELAVKETVVEKLKAIKGVEKVRRIAGNNLYDTAALIAKEVAPKGSKEVIVVSGEKFQDALSIASYAGVNGVPILLTKRNEVPKVTLDKIKELGAKKTLIIGGNLVVADGLDKKFPGAERIWGQTKFDTNVKVLNFAKPSSEKVYVATSDRFQDGLSGAALAAKEDAGILLVGNTLKEGSVTSNYLVESGVRFVDVFGGELAINADVYGKIQNLFAVDPQPELSVPFVGFNGDWNEAPVLDELAYDEHNSFYETAGMLYTGENEEGETEYYYLGYNPFTETNEKARIAISPNGDGVQDDAFPILSFLRNAKLVEYSILDKDGKQLRKLRSEKDVRKNYYDGGASGALPYTFNPANAWDGTVKKEVVKDGQYYYEIATTIDFAGKEAQKVKIPVIVDTVAPTVEASIEDGVLSLSGNDELSGLAYFEVFAGEKSLGLVSADTEELKFEEDFAYDTPVTVIGVDNAGNETEVAVNFDLDTTAPVITVNTPETFSIHDTSEVKVAGTVSDFSEVKSLTVEGQEVELVWDEEKSNYKFETTVTFEDGANEIKLVATDAAGNETSLSNSRTIFVDTTAPILEVDVETEVAADVETVDLKVKLSDNAEELRYFIDGSEEFYHEMAGYSMNAYSTEVTSALSLEPGENTFELEVVDLAGNKTTQVVTITRANADSGN